MLISPSCSIVLFQFLDCRTHGVPQKTTFTVLVHCCDAATEARRSFFIVYRSFPKLSNTVGYKGIPWCPSSQSNIVIFGNVCSLMSSVIRHISFFSINYSHHVQLSSNKFQSCHERLARLKPRMGYPHKVTFKIKLAIIKTQVSFSH